jgi:hypothetical protein
LKAFAQWPKTIKSLNLCFRQAETCWSKCASIGEYFPALESLTLTGWAGFGAASMRKLPPTVTFLELTYCNSFTDALLRDCLPESIEHLLLPGSAKISPAVGAYLPRTLKSFSTGYTSVWTANDIQALPQSLTSLSIHFEPLSANEIINFLPQRLKSLELRCFWGVQASFTAANWPSTLETLLLRDGSVTLVSQTLPASLTRLELGTVAEGFEVTSLPPSLRTFSVRDLPFSYKKTFKDPVLATLPSTLTHLSITSDIPITDDGLALLPKFLQVLHLHAVVSITGRGFKLLPRYLCSLELQRVQDITDEEIADLPRWITHLRLDSAKLLTDAFAIHLPRGLRLLNVSGNGNFTFKCLPHMPTHIYDIDLGQTGVGSKYDSDRNKRAKAGR